MSTFSVPSHSRCHKTGDKQTKKLTQVPASMAVTFVHTILSLRRAIVDSDGTGVLTSFPAGDQSGIEWLEASHRARNRQLPARLKTAVIATEQEEARQNDRCIWPCEAISTVWHQFVIYHEVWDIRFAMLILSGCACLPCGLTWLIACSALNVALFSWNGLIVLESCDIGLIFLYYLLRLGCEFAAPVLVRMRLCRCCAASLGATCGRAAHCFMDLVGDYRRRVVLPDVAELTETACIDQNVTAKKQQENQ
jgi:hypothetical protein